MTRLTLTFNGLLASLFKPSRRSRQGNPLSNLLFIFVMEDFSLMISKVDQGGYFEGYSVEVLEGEQSYICHLSYADDTTNFRGKLGYLCNEVVSRLRVNLSNPELCWDSV